MDPVSGIQTRYVCVIKNLNLHRYNIFFFTYPLNNKFSRITPFGSLILLDNLILYNGLPFFTNRTKNILSFIESNPPAKAGSRKILRVPFFQAVTLSIY